MREAGCGKASLIRKLNDIPGITIATKTQQKTPIKLI